MKKLAVLTLPIFLAFGFSFADVEAVSTNSNSETKTKTEVETKTVTASGSVIEDLVDGVLNWYRAGFGRDDIVNKVKTGGLLQFVETKLKEETETQLQLEGFSLEDIQARINAMVQNRVTLRQGIHNEYVESIQKLINKYELVSDDLDEDGIFGPATANAIKFLQRVNGLTEDGVIGPNTRSIFARLINELNKDVKDDDLGDDSDEDQDEDEDEDEGDDDSDDEDADDDEEDDD